MDNAGGGGAVGARGASQALPSRGDDGKWSRMRFDDDKQALLRVSLRRLLVSLTVNAPTSRGRLPRVGAAPTPTATLQESSGSAKGGTRRVRVLKSDQYAELMDTDDLDGPDSPGPDDQEVMWCVLRRRPIAMAPHRLPDTLLFSRAALSRARGSWSSRSATRRRDARCRSPSST